MKIESGFISQPSGSEWGLDAGTGTRTADQTVAFSAPFSSRPAVVVGISYINFENNGVDHALLVHVKRIENAFFEVEFTAFGDTKVRNARAFWLAHGDSS